MLKLGICSHEGISLARLQGFFGSRRQVSISVYDELCSRDQADRDAILERILRDFPTSSGTFRRTIQRFPEFDQATVEVIGKELDTEANLRIHDLGVSDGRTSFELFTRLSASTDQTVHLLATDLSPSVVVVSLEGLTLALDEAGEILQITWPPFVFNLPYLERPWLYPVNALLLRRLRRTGVPTLLRKYRAGDQRVSIRTFEIICPQLRRLMAMHPQVQYEKYDILKPSSRSFEIVRAMNLLNPDYFSQVESARAIGNVFASLTEGGLFVVGKNEGPRSSLAGAIYRKRSGRFEERFRTPEQPPIHRLVLEGAWARSASES